jgi:hypothetical protein
VDRRDTSPMVLGATARATAGAPSTFSSIISNRRAT